jgi:hypothetical protein
MWDREVYRVTMKNWTPPTTIGELPRANPRAGASTFGPVPILDVGVLDWSGNPNDVYFWASTG